MTFNLFCQFLFWISFLALIYTFLGYPMIMFFLGKIFSKTIVKNSQLSSPNVTVVLAVYNEEHRILPRLENIFTSAFAGKINVIVVSDGSTDATAQKISAIHRPEIKLILQSNRAGKAHCLNLALAAATSEIIVFADARQRFAPDTITKLAAHFSDPKIGAVSGELMIESAASNIGGGVDAYWRLEKFLRLAESQFDSSIGCTGAVYAIRRDLFEPIPADTLIDDVVIPMQIAVRGFRVLFEPSAVAYDPQSLEAGREKIRKQRTLAGNYQMLFRHLDWLLPWRNRLWAQLISHKYLRLFAPVFMLFLLAANIALLEFFFYRFLFFGQMFFYALAFIGMVFPGRKLILFSIPAGFVFLNFSALRGFWHYLKNSKQVGWQTAQTKTI